MAIRQIQIPQNHRCKECTFFNPVFQSIGGYCKMIKTDVYSDSLVCSQFEEYIETF